MPQPSEAEIKRINEEWSDYRRKMGEFFGYKMSDVPKSSPAEEKGRHRCNAQAPENISRKIDKISDGVWRVNQTIGDRFKLFEELTGIEFCPFCGERLE